MRLFLEGVCLYNERDTVCVYIYAYILILLLKKLLFKF